MYCSPVFKGISANPWDYFDNSKYKPPPCFEVNCCAKRTDYHQLDFDTCCVSMAENCFTFHFPSAPYHTAPETCPLESNGCCREKHFDHLPDPRSCCFRRAPSCFYFHLELSYLPSMRYDRPFKIRFQTNPKPKPRPTGSESEEEVSKSDEPFNNPWLHYSNLPWPPPCPNTYECCDYRPIHDVNYNTCCARFSSNCNFYHCMNSIPDHPSPPPCSSENCCSDGPHLANPVTCCFREAPPCFFIHLHDRVKHRTPDLPPYQSATATSTPHSELNWDTDSSDASSKPKLNKAPWTEEGQKVIKADTGSYSRRWKREITNYPEILQNYLIRTKASLNLWNYFPSATPPPCTNRVCCLNLPSHQVDFENCCIALSPPCIFHHLPKTYPANPIQINCLEQNCCQEIPNHLASTDTCCFRRTPACRFFHLRIPSSTDEIDRNLLFTRPGKAGPNQQHFLPSAQAKMQESTQKEEGHQPEKPESSPKGEVKKAKMSKSLKRSIILSNASLNIWNYFLFAKPPVCNNPTCCSTLPPHPIDYDKCCVRNAPDCAFFHLPETHPANPHPITCLDGFCCQQIGNHFAKPSLCCFRTSPECHFLHLDLPALEDEKNPDLVLNRPGTPGPNTKHPGTLNLAAKDKRKINSPGPSKSKKRLLQLTTNSSDNYDMNTQTENDPQSAFREIVELRNTRCCANKVLHEYTKDCCHFQKLPCNTFHGNAIPHSLTPWIGRASDYESAQNFHQLWSQLLTRFGAKILPPDPEQYLPCGRQKPGFGPYLPTISFGTSLQQPYRALHCLNPLVGRLRRRQQQIRHHLQHLQTLPFRSLLEQKLVIVTLTICMLIVAVIIFFN